MKFSVSATTRKPREGEVDGVDYFFVDRARFMEMVENNEFLEHAEYVENCYGTPKAAVERELEAGNDVILDIDVQGALQVHEQCPEALMVFLLPPSLEELENRLIKRGKDSLEVIKGRLKVAEHECSFADRFDYQIVNDDLERAVCEFNDVINFEKEKIINSEE